MTTEEHVVLVDENNSPIGTVSKQTVHTADTPLHRGFSAFLFNQKGELLLQQRSHVKKTWPLMWSNSVCGHPALGEENVDAARRRARFELGLELDDVAEVAPYRYKAVKDGVMENEICPILVGRVSNEPQFNPEEVEAVKWVSWQEFLEEIRSNPDTYSVWCREEAEILEKEGFVQKVVGLV
jgi:isopentenyl-diphosphate delta-isomerase